MRVTERAREVCGTLERIFAMADEGKLIKLVDEIGTADRVFVLGKGRSGIVMRMFAMRLMHLGLTAYVVGEATTPGIGRGDLLLIGSGSGKTRTCAVSAELAKEAGARVGLITAALDPSPIQEMTDFSVSLPVGPVIAGTGTVAQFGGSYFEEALLVCMDSIVETLREKYGIPYDFMRERHANLE